jgi:hypothetical protein
MAKEKAEDAVNSLGLAAADGTEVAVKSSKVKTETIMKFILTIASQEQIKTYCKQKRVIFSNIAFLPVLRVRTTFYRDISFCLQIPFYVPVGRMTHFFRLLFHLAYRHFCLQK